MKFQLKKNIARKILSQEKIQTATRALRTKLVCLCPKPKINTPSTDEKMLNQLQKNFNSTKNKSTNMLILTILPNT